MISELIASRMRAVVVVDNCGPDLHRRIAEVCRQPDSQVSAVTVEYDVQEDEPEGTEVFRLKPCSTRLVAKIVARRFPAMALPNVDRIAEFSGGNARIALALANALKGKKSIAGLRDEELFRRLFHQRQHHDDRLLRAAQACSLLYSFEGTSLNGKDAELPKLAELVNTNASSLYAHVAELKKRDIVQSRGVWRAVLPHAIANRLASMALRTIPLQAIMEHFETERLLKSFSRRIGYLHESEEAEEIATKWLAEGGFLSDVDNLTDFGIALFENIAPVSPELTLTAIERELWAKKSLLLVSNRRRGKVCAVLGLIAYDPLLFDRCVAAMIQFALSGEADNRVSAIRQLEGLFHIYFSGTLASIEQRATIADGLLSSSDSGRRSLGLVLLQALLKTQSFTGRDIEFGSRDRDYGLWPKDREEKANWYAVALKAARAFAVANNDTASEIRSTIAQAIWSIWSLGPEAQEQIEAVSDEIASNGYWPEGWIAVRSYLSRRHDKSEVVAIKRLKNLERRLRPRDVEERVRVIVLSPRRDAIDYADSEVNETTEPEEYQSLHQRALKAAEELGKTVGGDTPLLEKLLPELVIGSGGRLPWFGAGLAQTADNHLRVWDRFTQALAATDRRNRSVDCMRGFLAGIAKVDQPSSEAVLEEAVDHEILGEWFPILQSAVTISAEGALRLQRAAANEKAHPRTFHFLAWRHEVGPEALQSIVLTLAKRSGGFLAATDILGGLFHPDGDREKELSPVLIDTGRQLLCSPDFSFRDNMFDYHLQIIGDACLRGVDGAITARSLCERLKQGFEDYTLQTYNHEYLLQSIFQRQPAVALEVFFGSGEDPNFDVDVFDGLDHPSDIRKNPLEKAPVEGVIAWCEERPTKRYPAIAHVAPYVSAPKDGRARWHPLAIEMLKQAPDPVAVLEIFVSRFQPNSWSGSRASIIETRLLLLDELGELNNPTLDSHAARIRSEMKSVIGRMRRSEDEHDTDRDERFEY